MPPGQFQKDDMYARRRWRQVQYMADLFWKRWVKEYLPQLQERQKWSNIRRNFTPGDLVIIVDDSAPRNSWLTGRIVENILDRRGLVRQVRIKTKTGFLNRPITKICLLQETEDWRLTLKLTFYPLPLTFAPFLPLEHYTDSLHTPHYTLFLKKEERRLCVKNRYIALFDVYYCVIIILLHNN